MKLTLITTAGLSRIALCLFLSAGAVRSQTSQPADDCGCRAPVPEVLAVVNTVKISREEIDAQLKAELQRLESAVIEARKKELNFEINTRLLNAEAKKRNITPAALLEQEVIAKAVRPTEAQAQTFYNENKAKIEREFAQVKDQIIEYLLGQQQESAAKTFAEQLRANSDLKILVAEAMPPKTAADRARVLATLQGGPVTVADIEEGLRPLILDTQKQIYQLRTERVNLRINDLLLEQEAARQKTTTRALLETNVHAKRKVVSEADAQKFYEQNKERLKGEFAQIKTELIKYLEEVEQRGKETEYAEQLRRAAAVEVFIVAPAAP